MDTIGIAQNIKQFLGDQVDQFQWKTGETPFTQFEWLTSTLFCYFLSVALLTKFMETRENKLKWVDSYAVIHNITLSLLSLVLFVFVIAGALLDNRFASLDAFLCHRPSSVSKGLVPFTLYLVYLSKVLEFGDTWIMICSKRRVHWMHRMHHLSTMGMVWHALDTNLAAEVLAASTNLLGHFLLYMYLAFPSPSMRKWINLSQLLQFGGCLTGMLYMVYRRCTGDACEGSFIAEMHGIIMYSIYIAHMVYSYQKRYVAIKIKQSNAVHKVNATNTVASAIANTSTPCGEIGEVLAPCGELLQEKVVTPCVAAAKDSENKMKGLQLSIPSELFDKSFSPAVRILAKTVALGSVGIACINVLPKAMAPLGIFLIGMSMSWLLVIGQDCAQGSFFPSRIANDIVGTIVLLPLFRPIETFRSKRVSKLDNDKGALKEFVVGMGDTVIPSSLTLSHVTVCAFAVALLSSLVAHFGWSGLLQYWAMPYLLMQINMTSMKPSTTVLEDKNGETKSTETYQLLFPELSDFSKLPAPLQKAIGDIDLGRIPLYNLPKVFETLSDKAIDALSSAMDEGEDAVKRVLYVNNKQTQPPSFAPSFVSRLSQRLPSRLLVREILYWKKRDALLWAVSIALACSFVIDPTHEINQAVKQIDPTMLSWAPVILVLLFVFPKMTAATAIRRFKKSTKMYSKQMESEDLTQEEKDAALALKDKLAIEKFEKNQKLPWLQYILVNANWGMGIYITLSHILALMAFAYIPHCNPKTLFWAFILWPISGLGITAGVHRLWAHRSYNASLPFRFVVMIFNSIANQGNIYHWSRDHRVHHKWSETNADPHNALRGFFFAHVGWLYVVKDPRVSQAGRKISMKDLLQMPEVVLQRNLDPFWNLFWCFAFPAIFANYFWNESFANGFFVAGALRYIVVLHFTWCVNSAAHLWGETPYEKMNPAENPWVSIGAIGEGWHNWHHTFPYDYAASELGVSQQYNPTKLFIDLAAKLGLVWKRKRADKHWERRMLKRAKASASKEVQESMKGIEDDKLSVDQKLIGYPMLKRRVINVRVKTE